MGRSESLFGLSFTSPILPHHHQGKLMLFRGPRPLVCGPYYAVTIVLYDTVYIFPLYVPDISVSSKKEEIF